MSETASTILLIDDNADNLFVLEQVLSEHIQGLTIITANSPHEGLATAETLPIDLAVIDMQMPGMNGIETCNRLKGTRLTGDIPVILITSHTSTPSLRAQGLDTGASDFISRPIDNIELIARIKALLRTKQAQDRLRAATDFSLNNSALQSIIDGVADPVIVIAKDHRVLAANQAAQSLMSCAPPAEQSPLCHQAFLPHFRPCKGPDHPCPLKEVQDTGEPVTLIHAVRPEEGERRILEIHASPLLDESGCFKGIIERVRDITETSLSEARMQERENRIEFLARYDLLTNLPNRKSFEEHLQKAMHEAEQNGTQLAMLHLNLDRFRNINDSLGHAVGDQILQEVARRIEYWVPESGMVARLGSDEFQIVLEGFDNFERVIGLARKFLSVLSPPIEMAGHKLFVTGSIGISLFPAHAETSHGLICSAETAMKRAKTNGRNLYQLYSPEMNNQAQQRLELEGNLRQALELEQLALHYQPQIDLRTGRLIAMEALLRWYHPEKGIISPGEFIPLAEETGMIVPIGEWVLRSACSQNAAWQNAGHPPFRMAVNISARQFREPDFIPMIERVLKETGLDPHWLELEITESVIMENINEAVITMTDLKSRNVYLSIDDFGTGYSSLSYLKRFPVTKLKIDRSFVSDLTIDANDAAIVRSVVALGRSMHMEVIAEGVENRQQLHFLKEIGCDQGQGYLFSKPLPAFQIAPFIQKGGWSCSDLESVALPELPARTGQA